MDNIFRILWAILSTTFFAGLLGLGLAVAARKFRVEKDEKVESLIGVLPGLNCGACGYAGCEAYAEALAEEKDSDSSKCSPGGPETRHALSEILGVSSGGDSVRMVARVACIGGNKEAKKDFRYEGYKDCESAYVHFNGDKACKYGCLGMGSCVKACPVDAIDYTDNGLVEVDPEKCIGCEICVAVCPTGAMKMIPYGEDYFVACNSKDKGKATKSVCSVGCIACRICEKKFPDAGFIVTDNLSVLDYNKGTGEGREGAAAACPTNCIIKIKES